MKNIILLVFVVIYGTGCVAYRDSHREIVVGPWAPYPVTASYDANGYPINNDPYYGAPVSYYGGGSYYNYGGGGGGGYVIYGGGRGGYHGGGGSYYNYHSASYQGGGSHGGGQGGQQGGGQHR